MRLVHLVLSGEHQRAAVSPTYSVDSASFCLTCLVARGADRVRLFASGTGAKRSGGGDGIGGVGEGAHHHQPVRPSCHHVGGVGGVDATDSEPRFHHRLAGFGLLAGGILHQLQAYARAPGFGGGGPDGASAELVDVGVGHGGIHIGGGVATKAQDHLVTENLSGYLGGNVVLSDVGNIGAGCHCQIHAVVDGQ